MIIQIILGFCGETGTLGAIKFTSRTNLSGTSKAKPCDLGTTNLTSNCFVRKREGMSVISVRVNIVK